MRRRAEADERAREAEERIIHLRVDFFQLNARNRNAGGAEQRDACEGSGGAPCAQRRRRGRRWQCRRRYRLGSALGPRGLRR